MALISVTTPITPTVDQDKGLANKHRGYYSLNSIDPQSAPLTIYDNGNPVGQYVTYENGLPVLDDGTVYHPQIDITGPITFALYYDNGSGLELKWLDPDYIPGESVLKDQVSIVYDNVSEMIADDTLILDQSVTWLGYYSAGDGGGNSGIVVAAATGTDDGGSFFDLNNGLQVQSLFNNDATCRQFGATNSNSIIYTDKIQALIDFASTKNLTATANINDIHIVDGPGVLVPSNTKINFNNAIIRNLDASNNVACFRIDRASSNILISNCNLQGAYYDGSPITYSDWNMGVVVYGAYYRNFDPITSLPRGAPLVDAPASENINISNCEFVGFATSGCQADTINNLTFFNNKINRCGRDGIRCYGVVGGVISDNHITDLTPGFGGIAPNLNVYGITLTRVYASPVSEYRRSEAVSVTNNYVNGAWTWKSLDTHGAINCSFTDNKCHNSHIGIGIAQGSNDGSVTTENNIVSNNIIVFEPGSNPYTIPRAGVTMFAGASGIGKNIIVDSNYIEGYGEDAGDGAISVSRQQSAIISNNIINKSLKAAITVIEPSNVDIKNNKFIDPIQDSFSQDFGIAVQDTDSNVVISNNTFEVTVDGTSCQGVSIPFPNPGFLIDIDPNNVFINCDIDIVQPNRINSGGWKFQTWGNGRILNDGVTATFDIQNGIFDTVTRDSVGVVTITVSRAFFNFKTMWPECSTISSTAIIFGITAIDETTFTVRTTNNAGTIVDTGFSIRISGY